MARHLLLIRAIGGATHATMPLRALAARCEASGFEAVRSVLATGNLVIDSGERREAVRRKVAALVAEFGLANEVFAPAPGTLGRVLKADPFPDAARDRPAAVAVFFGHAALALDGKLAAYEGPERLAEAAGTLVVDYGDRITGSKLPPARVERLVGKPLTFRNWNTLERLAQALRRD